MVKSASHTEKRLLEESLAPTATEATSEARSCFPRFLGGWG